MKDTWKALEMSTHVNQVVSQLIPFQFPIMITLFFVEYNNSNQDFYTVFLVHLV